MTALRNSTLSDGGFPRRMRLSDEAAAHVRDLIVAGKLKGGEFIRPEAVAERLGISATPIREGLLQLQTDGLLHVAPRRGFIVASLSEQDIRDGAQAHALLAGELCARTATLITAADLSALARTQKDLESADQDGNLDDVERLNIEFHMRIYRLANSPVIYRLVESTITRTPRRLYQILGGWPAGSTRDHRAILEALKAADGDAARQAIADDINRNGQLLATHMASLTS
jgi:DNA-binding GntR family transcriptional regulator